MSNVGCLETAILLKLLNEEINGSKLISIKPFIQRACANMFFSYMCSLRFEHNDLEFCEIVEFFDKIFWEINQGYVLDFLPWLAPFYKYYIKKIVHWSSTIRCFIMNRVIKRRELFKNQPEDDFTEALLKHLSDDKDVARDTILFMLEDFIGGHSAVGNLVMLTLMYLAKNPIVAKKIQLEGDLISPKEQHTISFYDIDAMPYTIATIFEVLRCSSSPIVPHVATEDVVISGYGIAKGTIVFINNYKSNYSKLYWKQPHCFQPERFLEQRVLRQPGNKPSTADYGTGAIFVDNPKGSMGTEAKNYPPQLKKNISFFLPFSIGKRTCIGQNLVRGFGFILVANILRQYDIKYENNTTIDVPKGSIALPANPMPLLLVKRNQNF
ncbi:cytochrome P450 307a1 isoform X2 [Rhagoletis pomonella]|nr:cytochrome P450 307a1 isoform X2 [Rhagoletis pomonella]